MPLVVIPPGSTLGDYESYGGVLNADFDGDESPYQPFIPKNTATAEELRALSYYDLDVNGDPCPSPTKLITAIMAVTLKGKVEAEEIQMVGISDLEWYKNKIVVTNYYITWIFEDLTWTSGDPFYRMIFWTLLFDNRHADESTISALREIYNKNYRFIVWSDYRSRYFEKFRGIAPFDPKDEALWCIDGCRGTTFARLLVNVYDNGWSNNGLEGRSYGWTTNGYQRIKFTPGNRLVFHDSQFGASVRGAFSWFLEDIILPRMTDGSIKFNSGLDNFVDEPRMFFVVNADAKMRAGKIASQVGHAAMLVTEHMLSNNMRSQYDDYVDNGMPKIVLKASHAVINQLIASEVYEKTFVVTDHGFTQVSPDTVTVISWLPMTYVQRDKNPILKSLKLV